MLKLASLLFSPLVILLSPSPVSFISAVRKLLTPIHTCKPGRVKAFHKFLQHFVRLLLFENTHTQTVHQVLTALRS